MLRSVYESAQDSEGSAQEELDKYLDSIDGKIQQIKTAGQNLLYNMIDSDLIKEVIDDGTEILSGLNEGSRGIGEIMNDLSPIVSLLTNILKLVTGIVDKIGIIPTVVGTISTVGSLKNNSGIIQSAGKTISKIQDVIENQKFFSNFSFSESEQTGILNYFKLFEAGSEKVDKANEAFNALNVTQQDFVTAAKSSGKSSTQIAAGFKGIDVGARASAIGVNILKAALNTIITIGITFAIQKLLEVIDNAIHKTELLQEAAEEAKSTIDDAESTFDEQKSTVEDVAEEYAKLAQGVKNLGKANQSQGTLSTEEYERFNELSQELIDKFPSLRGGLTSTGDAMTTLSGSASEITESLESLLEVEEKLKNQEIREQLPDIINNSSNSYGNNKKTYDNANYSRDDMLQLISEGKYTIKDVTNESDLERAVYQYILDTGYGEITASAEGIVTFEFSDEDIKYAKNNIEDYYNEIITTSEENAQLAKINMESDNKELQSALDTYVQTSQYYDADSDLSTVMTDFANNITYESLDTAGVNIKDSDAITDYVDDVMESMVVAFAQMPDNISKQIHNYLFGDLSFEDYQSAYDQIYDYLTKSVEDGGLGLNSDDDLVVYFRAQLQERNLSDMKAVDRLFTNASFADKFAKFGSYLEKYRDLSDEEKEAVNALGIPDGVFYSWDEILELINKTADASSNVADAQSTISESVKSMADQIEPQFSELESLYTSIFEFDDSGKNITGINEEALDISSLESFRQSFEEIEDDLGITFESSKVDDFFAALKGGNADVKDIQQAFNDLATEWFYSTDVIDDLNDTTAETYKAMLDNAGVVNSQEVIDYWLSNKEAAQEYYDYLFQAKQTDELSKAIIKGDEEEINSIRAKIAAYYEEVGATDIVKEAMFELAYQEYIEANTGLDTSAKCSALIELANSYLDVASAASFAARVEQLENTMSHAGSAEAADAAKAQLDKLLNGDFQELRDKYSAPIQVKWDTSNDSDSGSSDSDSDEDPIVTQYEDSLSILEWLRDNNFIDEKEYYDQLRILTENSFQDRTKYAEDYYEHMHDMLEGLKDEYDTALSDIISLFEDQIEEFDDAQSEAEDALEETQEKQKQALQDQIDAQQDLIDSKQDEIDKIKEEHEAREKDLELQKAQYELERARNQRTKLIYTDQKGYNYVTDTDAVKDAQEDVDDIKYDMQISALEKELDLLQDVQDKLNDDMDDLEESFDKQKQELEDYYDTLRKPYEDLKTQWEELQKMAEDATVIDALKNIGLNVGDVLNGTSGVFESFKASYLGLFGDLYADDTNMLESLREAFGVDDLGSYLANTQNALSNLNTLDLSGYAEAIASSRDGVYAIRDSMDILDTSILTMQENISGGITGIIGDAYTACESVQESIDSLHGKDVEITIKTHYEDKTDETNKKHAEGTVGNAFANGTGGYNGLSSSEHGALRSEYGQPELTVYPNGTYELTTTPTISDLPKDTVIFDEEQTRRILSGKNKNGKAFASGTGATYTPLSSIDPDKYALLTSFTNFANVQIPAIKDIENTIDAMARQMGVSQVTPNNINKAQNISINIGDIQLSGVQDVNGLSRAIVSQLPNMLLQEIHRN